MVFLGDNLTQSTADILDPKAAERVSRLSIMSKRISFSESDSESDEDINWFQARREEIKKE